MKLHNLMEEAVLNSVNTLYDNLKESKASWLTCDCENCRLDTMAYVLNRIPAKYIVSSRGVTHTATDSGISQLKADIDTLAIEGIRLVSSSKRPTHNITMQADFQNVSTSEPYYCFPTFTGTVLDGTTFEPLENAEITLTAKGQICQMLDQSWANPAKTYKATKGTYTFCVKPEVAEKDGIDGHFDFKLEVKCKGYEPTSYAFSIPVTSKYLSENKGISFYSLKIQDLFLFAEGLENPME
ncbi:MAG: late competence development ComFB family protein [Treponema sp.]|nr:late competence development ComFB family protein [Treponema sp.]